MERVASRKLKKTEIQDELHLIRSLLISFVGKDEEGNYRPEFVREVLSRSQDKPNKTFKGKKQFLKLLSTV